MSEPISFTDPESRDFICTPYSIWFFENQIWNTMSWCGIKTMKSPSDMWNYQEIISRVRPSLIVEFGTYQGGSALYMAEILRTLGLKSRVLTVDPNDWGIPDQVRNHPLIELHRTISIDPKIKERIKLLREAYPGPMFVILDGDHSAENVYRELLIMKDLTVAGDYLINEDSNMNGHPIMLDHDGGSRDPATFKPGPWDALRAYEEQYPNDYIHDIAMEHRFGWTLATDGYLLRK
jgi:cephalosporin hydroxylase